MQVLEDADAVAPAGARPSVRPTSSRQIALGDDRQPRRRQRDAVVQRGDGDAPSRRGEVGGLAVDDRKIDAVVEQDVAQARRRTGAVGGDDNPEPVRQQLGEPASEAGAVAGDRTPAGRLDDRRVGRLRSRVDRPERLATAGEQAVRLGVQTRERQVPIAAPRRRQGGGEVVLLGEQIDGTIAAAPRFDEHDLGRVRQYVGEQGRLGAVVEPGHPALHPLEEGSLGDSLPLLAPPRLAGDEPARPLAQLVAGQQLTGREDQGLGEVARRALIVDAERRQPVDLVAPQVDAHRSVASRREHVDDRPAAGELAAVLDQLLAPVAEVDEASDQLVGIDDRRRGARRSARSSALQGRSVGAAPACWRRSPAGSAAGHAGATAPRGADPSSRRTG